MSSSRSCVIPYLQFYNYFSIKKSLIALDYVWMFPSVTMISWRGFQADSAIIWRECNSKRTFSHSPEQFFSAIYLSPFLFYYHHFLYPPGIHALNNSAVCDMYIYTFYLSTNILSALQHDDFIKFMVCNA